MTSTASLATQPQMPMWPFVLLVFLLLLGLSFSRDRLVSRRAVAIVPIVMVLMSLGSLRSAFGLVPLTAGAWLAGLTAATLATVAGKWPRGVTWDEGSGRLRVPGSWVPLVLFVAIFATRFVVGTVQGMHLPLGTDPQFAAGMALLYGTFSGVFLGRSVVMGRAAPASPARLATTPV